MPAGVPPGVEVVAHDRAVEAELLREDPEPQEIARCELLRRRFPAECQHEPDGTQETGAIAGWLGTMSVPRLVISGVHGLPEIRPGDDLPRLIVDALRTQGETLRDGDVLAVAQKIVSKSEGRIVRLADVVPSPRATAMAEEAGKDPRQLEVV